MKIETIAGSTARCSAAGVKREVNLFLLEGQNVAVGDFVMVHVGYAIQKVDPEAAQESRALYAQMQDAPVPNS